MRATFGWSGRRAPIADPVPRRHRGSQGGASSSILNSSPSAARLFHFLGALAPARVLAQRSLRMASATSLTHGMADLVEADDHVAGGIESRDARPLVAVDPDAIVARKLGADHLRLRVRVRAERG